MSPASSRPVTYFYCCLVLALLVDSGRTTIVAEPDLIFAAVGIAAATVTALADSSLVGTGTLRSCTAASFIRTLVRI